MYDNFFKVNDLLRTWLQEGKSFCLMRIDNTAGYVMDCLLKGQVPVEEFYNPHTLLESGVNPASMDYAFNVVQPKTMEVMYESDILGFVDISGEIKNGEEFSKRYFDRPTFFRDDCLVLDPGALVGETYCGVVENPWTQYLKGKKVLAISSHAESINQQWKNIDNVWGDKKDKIVPFDLVDCISTPFHPVWDNRQYPDCENWEDLIRITKDRIDQYDYDVLLTGVTTQSPFYAAHAKSKGKVGIQLGGAIQLFFGVKGKRWVEPECYAKWRPMFNENWIYPLEIDQPQKRDQFRGLESTYAYWGN